jgi:hypothetical protein
MVTWTEGRVRSTGVAIVEVVPIGSSQPAPVEKKPVRDECVVVGKELFIKIGNGENGVTGVAFSQRGNLPTTVTVGVLELAVANFAQIRGTIDTAADYEYEIVMTGRDPSKGVTYAHGKIIVAQPKTMNAKPLYAAVGMAFSVELNLKDVGVVTAALLLDTGGLPDESVKVSRKDGGVFVEGSVRITGEYKYVVELTGEDPAVDVFHVKGTITAEDITLSRVSLSTQDVTPGNDIADVEFTTTGATVVGVNTEWKSSSDDPYVAVEHDERMHSIWDNNNKKVTVKGKPAKVGFYLCTVWALHCVGESGQRSGRDCRVHLPRWEVARVSTRA